MMYENVIEKVFREYLDMQGYRFSDDDLRELVDVYWDCQEWDDEKPLTGMTEIEMIDWVKHTSEVVRIAAKNERYMGIRKMLFTYLEMSKKSIFVIDIAS